MTQQEFFNRYQYNPKADKLGGGTFGKVFKAYDTVRNRYVAIKVAEVLELGNKTLSLQDELDAVGNLPDHTNIAHYEEVHQFQSPQGEFDYAIMQYYPDGSLADVIANEAITLAHKKQIADGILAGVAFLHQHKVTHRDLKPANILIVKHNNTYIPKIADFGLSKNAEINDKSFFENSIKGGTIAYSSPEQLLGNDQLHLNTDIWSVGVILYSLFTGELPFNATEKTGSARDLEIQKKILKAPIPNAINYIPEPYQNFIKQCLVKEADKRVRRIEHLYTTNTEETIIEETVVVEEQTIVEPPKPQQQPLGNINQQESVKPEPIKPTSNGSKKIWIALAGLVLVVATVVLWQKKQQKTETPPTQQEANTNSFKTFTETVNGVSFKMVAVEGGSFNMGSNDGEADEKPVHKVRLSNYYMGETEVTQALWRAVMGSNPSRFKGKNNPVDNVSWNNAQAFIKKLNKLTGKAYRLPTEAEWEFAARGGVKSKGYQYSGSNSIDEVAWYGDNSGKKTQAVKQKKSNELGLYDMTGNVEEWCNDLYDADYYKVSPMDNPQGPSSGTYPLLRGGSWINRAKGCRSAYRIQFTYFSGDFYGFRLTLSTVK